MKDLLSKILRPFRRLLFKLFYRPEIKGIENLPRTSSTILIGTRRGDKDFSLLSSSLNRCVYSASLKNVKNIAKSKKVLEKGEMIAVLKDSSFPRDYIDVLSLADDTSSYIVPFAITGNYKLLKNDLKITFGKAYRIVNRDLSKQRDILLLKMDILIEEEND